MGGLAGAIAWGERAEIDVVRRMIAELAHRGPDGSGEWASGPAAIAHRLRKVAPTRSMQPLVTETAIISLDGWIYDHEDVIRRAAAALGESAPKGLPDPWALAWGWRAWGSRVAEEIDGEFAAALWDVRTERLVLVRDRLGVRPMYWARHGRRMVFASELGALLASGWVSRELARDHLAEWLEFGFVHAPRTLLGAVSQVEPAHVLEADSAGVRTRPYWRIRWPNPWEARPADVAEIDGLQAAVDRAVGRRVDPGAATGLYLSGGLGSTAIAVAARERFLTVPTFTATFADDPNPESPFAGRIARLLGLENHEIVIGSADLAAAFDPAVKALGHPIGHPSVLVQLILARAARERVRVVLSGDGGDELFGSRALDPLARGLGIARAISRLPAPLRRAASRTQWGRFSGPLPGWISQLGLAGQGLFTAAERVELLRDRDLGRAEVLGRVLTPLLAIDQTDPVNAVLAVLLRSTLAESTLTRADRTAAASGLDVRFPLLDREVVERAAALSGRAKVRRAGWTLHTRWPLRALVSGAIPQSLANRPKRGMPVPFDGWLGSTGRLFLEDRFARLRRDPHQLWQPARLDLLRSQVGTHPRAGRQLWALLLLHAWLEQLG